MYKSLIGVAMLVVVCATVFANGLGQSNSGESLPGKYVFIHAEPDFKRVCKFESVQKLGTREFAVCEVADDNKKISRAFIPIDSIKMISVFESKEAALGQSNEPTKVSGLVTMRGKPVVATILFHDVKGGTYHGETKGDGKFELSNIPAGSYTVTFENVDLPPKYRRVAESHLKVLVTSGSNELNFELE